MKRTDPSARIPRIMKAVLLPLLALAISGAIVFPSTAEAQLKLKADSATSKQVALSWSGGAGRDCRLQRRAGPATSAVTWATIATTKDSSAKDTKIDAGGTYWYRVNCAAENSNEVTVGPPPSGFHLIAPKPDKHPDTALGRVNTVALDGNGDPAVAFIFADVNGDGHFEDSEIQFVAWDRAKYAWRAPVSVAVVGVFDPRVPEPGVSLAHDASTNAYAIAYGQADHKSTNLAISHDDGATWTNKKIYTDPRSVNGAVLVLGGGKIYLVAAIESKNDMRFVTGNLDDDPSKWEVSFPPHIDNTNGTLRASSIAMDSNGRPGVAFWLRPSTGTTWTLGYWLPTNQNWTRVTDTEGSAYPPDGVILAYAGTKPGIILDSRLVKGQISSHYFTTSKDEGMTWSVLIPIADDGNEHIGGFMGFAMATDGRAAFAGDVAGGNTQNMKCTWPKLARTADLVTWKTCSPQGGMTPEARSNFGTVIYSPSGTLYMIFQSKQYSPSQTLKPGLMIWGGR
jgi:hypothetical protein